MKLIWITQESLFPLNTGGRIGVFKRLEQLYRENEIYLFYTYDNEEEVQYISELTQFCKGVFAYKRKKKNFSTLIRSLKYPFCVASRSVKSMQHDIEKCIIENNISLINVDFPQMCVNIFQLAKKYSLNVVLNEHNIEWQFYKMISKSSPKFLRKAAYGFDSKRLKRYEEKLVKKIRFDAITFVSEKDLEYHKNWLPVNIPRILIPVGADKKDVCAMSKATDSKTIIFVGKMSASPNAEAAIWFAKNVFPIILSKCPKAKFFIIGKNPTNDVLSLAGQSIVVTGGVDSVEEYYEMADLVVVPLLHGGGVKVKLLEAVSYKKPIVTTETGVEGTLFENAIDMWVEEEPKGFAEKCITILSDGEKAKILVENAYNKFLENYTWEHIGKKYTALLNAVCEKPAGQ